MANGVNHAKQIVLDEAEELVKEAEKASRDLSNGKAGDLQTMSRAITIICRLTSLKTRMLAPMYAADFVTVDECRRQHAIMLQEQKDQCTSKQPRMTPKLKIGPVTYEGGLNAIIFFGLISLGSLSAFFFCVGKLEKWW